MPITGKDSLLDVPEEHTSWRYGSLKSALLYDEPVKREDSIERKAFAPTEKKVNSM